MTKVATLIYIGETMNKLDRNFLKNFSPLLIAAAVMVLMLFSSNVAGAEPKPSQWPMCAACHGQQGQGSIGPMLAGQNAEQIITKLNIYKKGGTIGPQSAMMWGTAKTLSDTDIDMIAKYIESLGLQLASN